MITAQFIQTTHSPWAPQLLCAAFHVSELQQKCDVGQGDCTDADKRPYAVVSQPPIYEGREPGKQQREADQDKSFEPKR